MVPRLSTAGGSPLPLPPQEALRKAQEELEEAERRRKAAAEARESSSGVGLRLPLSPESLRRLQAEGGLAWSKEGPGLDASYSFYNVYREGETLEAVQATADAGFGALAAWLKEQQAAVEMNFYMERDRLQRVAAAEKEQALAALRLALTAEFEQKLAMELQILRVSLEAEKQEAISKVRAEAAAATAAALARQEEQLKAKWEAELERLRASYEAQLESLRAAAKAMEEKHAAAMKAAAAAAEAEKAAALAQLKAHFFAKYRIVSGKLTEASEMSIGGCMAAITALKGDLAEYQAEAEKM